MRGDSTTQTVMLSLTTTDDLIPEDHPIRRVKPIVDRALSALSPVFAEIYSQRGRPSCWTSATLGHFGNREIRAVRCAP